MATEIFESVFDQARAWPFEEARKIVKRLGVRGPEKDHVVLETGYGPSGLPHIGTFGEVFRTTMVRNAFARLSDVPTRLIAFSDDMDGLRKVPDNIPDSGMVAEFLNKPLTRVPDPFGTHESFGHHNNARLRSFLDSFGFEYEFLSSTECYTSGRFNDALMLVLRNYDAIMSVMLPTLRAERQRTYSPFLPICARTGNVLQVPIIARDADACTIVYRDPDTGANVETPVTGGHCKLQWKVDWAMRWHALGVDYEMAGKDLIESVKASSKICRILGSAPPDGFSYELFLDEHGRKISKSEGNGIAIEQWLKYGPPESLSLFMFQNPRRAKRMSADVIPRATDDYVAFRAGAADAAPAKIVENPAWHLHGGAVPEDDVPLGFGLLLNLASVCHAEDVDVIWGYIQRYAPDASPEANPFLDHLAKHAVQYYQDVIRPDKVYRTPDPVERMALEDLAAALSDLASGTPAEDIQTTVYEVGKRHPFENLRDWFKALYQILLGQDQGPRFGSFIAVYGLPESIAMITQALQGAERSD